MAKKQIWVVVGLVALLVLTGYLNYLANAPKDDQTAKLPQATDIGAADPGGDGQTVSAAANFFADFRAERTSMRAQEVEYFDSVIANPVSAAETVNAAQLQKMELASMMEKELVIEGVLKAKGFTDVVVTYHPGSVNVVVDQAEVTDAQVAQVLELVTRETGEAAGNIKIVPTR